MPVGLGEPRAASAANLDLRTRLSAPPSWRDPLLCFDPDLLPPLPEIKDSAIAEQVFSHRSVHTAKGDLSLLSRISKSYEPLEGLGDRILHSEVYHRLRRQRRDATPGLLGDYAGYLTANRTLSYLSLAYGLPGRVVHAATIDLSLNQKIAADVFEAYVGGLYDDAGLEGISAWFDALFSLATWPALAGLMDTGLARLERVAPTDAARHAGETAIRATPHECPDCAEPLGDVPRTSMHFDTLSASQHRWHAIMTLDGKVVSCGRGLNKREAEADARDRVFRRLL